jgi:hypothetical protein
VQVVAEVPADGPVPPPIMVVTPLISASSICCGQMKWMRVPPAVTIMPSPAMISVAAPMAMVTPGWMSGLPALPMPATPFFRPMSALTIPQWSTMTHW